MFLSRATAIDNNDRIDGLSSVFDCANMIKHTLDSPVRRNGDKLGGHYPARTVLGVWQQLVERYPRLGTDTGQQVVSDRYAHFPDDVGRPVSRYLFNQVRGSLAWQVGDDGGTVT
jgi:hypothetical protein